MSTKNLQIVGSINADTLDGKHANEFAAASDMAALQVKVGATSVAEQINTAISTVLPVTSTADNGKFLRVVDGAWTAVAVLSAEEVAF